MERYGEDCAYGRGQNLSKLVQSMYHQEPFTIKGLNPAIEACDQRYGVIIQQIRLLERVSLVKYINSKATPPSQVQTQASNGKHRTNFGITAGSSLQTIRPSLHFGRCPKSLTNSLNKYEEVQQ